jgi:hypothetical protein
MSTQPIYFLKFPDVLNVNPTSPGTLDFDSFQWWVER